MTLRLSLGRIWKLSCPPQLIIYALSLSREENGLLGSVLGALGWNSRLSCWLGVCCGLCLGAEPSITASAAAALAERGEYVGVSDVLGIRVRSRGPVPRVECFNAGWNWDFVA